ncbi:hypothetical protein STSP2_00143 [Anaerohalosphaera lusitana]|uniref:Tetratricopeptide repeat protein n=1 Tax=Anaerohalosphaera lusitana TaxID=1936003 RepID=A0A1U9NGR7_9BACT|nr:tetratricopeptide repeat protein [Anaerohalosphaera lusitana]AQT67005.1 hypothetical protein STSP2_00143 [Anaerohalosphaera lusitana]
MTLRYKILAAALVVLISFVTFAQPQRGSNRSHLLNPTQPVTAGQRGLRRSTSEIDYQNRNLLITGNVAGNRNFRGNVPYQSQYEFRGSLGSDDLNDFIRRSADPIYDRNPGTYTPYYLPSQTVTTLQRSGQSGLQSPTLLDPSVMNVYQVARPQDLESLTFTGTRDYFTGSTDDLERELDLQLSVLQVDEYQERELSPTDITSLVERDDLKPQRIEDMDEDEQDLRRGELERLERKFDESLEPIEPDEPLEPLTPEEMVEMQKEGRVIRERREAVEPEVLDEEEGDGMEVLPEEKMEEAEPEEGEEPVEEPELTPSQKARAREILEEYGSFEAFAEERYDKHMSRANGLLEEGKFYKAADAFDLAAIYKSKEPDVYAGKSLALFASGSYVTSSYLLQRTLKMEPGYVEEDVDLEELMGGKAKLSERVKDLQSWYDRNNAPELALLLSYVHYQMGDYDQARAILEQAGETVEGSEAVQLIEGAIEKAVKSSGGSGS